MHLLDMGGNLPVRLYMERHGWRPCGHDLRLGDSLIEPMRGGSPQAPSELLNGFDAVRGQ